MKVAIVIYKGLGICSQLFSLKSHPFILDNQVIDLKELKQ